MLLFNKRIILLLLACYAVPLFSQPCSKPFPQHVKYFAGSIEPNLISQPQLDSEVSGFYSKWKKRFIKNTPIKAQSFVWFENVRNKQCVSEGQGYGMIITALMAGYDHNAKTTYDNLFRYFKAHPSGRSRHLMAWAQLKNGKDLDNTSASDGDIDIAYSLLLANQQWGSNGPINYLKEAIVIISAIMQYEINHKTWTVLLSDGVEPDSKDYFSTRSSDFMPANFKAFEAATNDNRWDKVINAGYKLLDYLQEKYSPDAGLLPDFIIQLDKRAKPAPAHFLESKYDGEYNYNACRVPWRIATDYLLTGDKRSKVTIGKINRWIRETTNNNTYNLSAGYTLAGNDIKGRYFEALSFVAPFGVAAMVDKKNEVWLNNVWKYLIAFKMKDFDYYDNTIKLLNMIIISGNYWDAR